MKQLIEFKSGDGEGVLVVETDLPGQEVGRQQVSRGGKIVAQATTTFEDALSKLKPLTDTVIKTLHDLNNPDELSVEFGITMSAEAGIVVAAASGSANFKISLKWKKA